MSQPYDKVDLMKFLFCHADYGCCSYRFEDQSIIHPDIHSLDENDIDRTDSLWNNIGIKYMDGYRVSNDE